VLTTSTSVATAAKYPDLIYKVCLFHFEVQRYRKERLPQAPTECADLRMCRCENRNTAITYNEARRLRG
jgi:hypothetical protein